MSLGSTPSIASIGIIGQYDNPLHIKLFPPYNSSPDSELEMQFLLNSSLDIFDIRLKSKPLDQDLGLLHAVDERLAVYGYLTNTGIKFMIVIDMMGRPQQATDKMDEPMTPGAQVRNLALPPVLGLKDSDLRPAFKAIQNAYVNLLMNPFYVPETRTPMDAWRATGKNAEIKSPRFGKEMDRIGRTWYPGIGVV